MCRARALTFHLLRRCNDFTVRLLDFVDSHLNDVDTVANLIDLARERREKKGERIR